MKSCVAFRASNAALFGAMRLGHVNSANQLTEKFWADDIIQPVSGIANSSR